MVLAGYGIMLYVSFQSYLDTDLACVGGRQRDLRGKGTEFELWSSRIWVSSRSKGP